MNINVKRLAALSLKNPSECFGRILTAFEARLESAIASAPQYAAESENDGYSHLGSLLQVDASSILVERQLADIETEVRQKQEEIRFVAPFELLHNGDNLLARVCYLVTRALRPRAIVETGVCYGVTSAYLLKALEVNGLGHLHSIDLPPLGDDGDSYVGRLIPHDLRRRWTLHRGTTRRLLRPLVEGLTEVSLFVHDSLHTYRNMRMEFDLAWPCIQSGGALISDDIENNTAFLELSARQDVANFIVVRQLTKKALVGIAVKS